MKPSWIEDENWKEKIDILYQEDIEWIEKQWEMSNGDPPKIDMTWVRYDFIK